MTHSIVMKLIAKDLYFNRWLIGLAIPAGLATIWLMVVNEMVGSIAFVTLLIVCSIFIGLVSLTKERTERASLFVLSLPVSTMQYTAAKVVAASVGYLVVWGVMLTAVLVLSYLDPTPPDGGLQTFVAIMTLLLTNFFVLLAVGVITTSELAVAAAIILTNSTVPLFFARSGPADGEGLQAASAGWTPALLAAFALEAAIIAFCLALIFYTQSRRRDFV